MAACSIADVEDNPRAWRFATATEAGLGWMPGPFTEEDECDRQPFEADELTMVADARLDNRDELLAALGIWGADRRRVSDCALILEAFKKWREGTPPRLLGDFAFAVWNSRSRTLFCARDHRGKRPFFYHRHANIIAFASSSRALLPLSHVPRRLNYPALADFMAFMSNPSTTLLEGILRVPPAHYLIATATDVCLREYWHMGAWSMSGYGTDEECLEEFRSVFTEAVACRLRSPHPIGAFLSGGLDSSSVACVAARLLQFRGDRLTTFTSVPRLGFEGVEVPGYYNDETPYIEAIRALHINLDVTYVRTEGQTFMDGLDRSFDLLGFPVVNSANWVWINSILHQAALQGLRVMLNGTEGNLWMSYKGATKRGEWAQITSLLQSHGLRASVRATQSLLTRQMIARFLPEPVWRTYRRFRARSPWSANSPMRAEFAIETKVRERYLSSPLGPMAREHSRVALATETLSNFENDLHSVLRLRYGVDMRDPTADKRVIEFCLKLPDHHFARAGQRRLLVRQAMHGLVPPEVLWNQRRGLQAADRYERMCAVRGEITSELARLERCETAVRCLDLPRMRRALHTWPGTADPQPLAISRELDVLARGITVGRFIRWFEAN